MPDSDFPELIMSTDDFDGKIQSGLKTERGHFLEEYKGVSEMLRARRAPH